MVVFPTLIRPTIAALRTDAERGVVDAMFRLSERLCERPDCSFDGSDWDGPQSLRWLKAAAEVGHPAAMFRLGKDYERGDGIPRDLRAAYYWIRRAEVVGVTIAREEACEIGRMLDPEVRREVDRGLGMR